MANHLKQKIFSAETLGGKPDLSTLIAVSVKQDVMYET
jgi:hypothetical protein